MSLKIKKGPSVCTEYYKLSIQRKKCYRTKQAGMWLMFGVAVLVFPLLINGSSIKDPGISRLDGVYNDASFASSNSHYFKRQADEETDKLENADINEKVEETSSSESPSDSILSNESSQEENSNISSNKSTEEEKGNAPTGTTVKTTVLSVTTTTKPSHSGNDIEDASSQSVFPVDEEKHFGSEEDTGIGIGPEGFSPDAILRLFYVFVGVGVIVLVYILIKLLRLRRKRAVRKYKVLSHSDEQEMCPLAADEGEDEEIFNAANHQAYNK